MFEIIIVPFDQSIFPNSPWRSSKNTIEELNEWVLDNKHIPGRKPARWIELDSALDWEKLREDNRRTVNEVIEIHVPDDFTIIGPTNIDAKLAEDLEKRKLQVKREMANDALIHINYEISGLSSAQKMALLSRSDVASIMQFLNFGSIEDSRDLIASLIPDANLTQEIIDSVVAFLDVKITAFNNTNWS